MIIRCCESLEKGKLIPLDGTKECFLEEKYIALGLKEYEAFWRVEMKRTPMTEVGLWLQGADEFSWSIKKLGDISWKGLIVASLKCQVKEIGFCLLSA